MGASSSAVSLEPEEIEQLSKDTGFTPYQVNRLYTRFQRLDRTGRGEITREDFLSIPELAMNPLSERIVAIFTAKSDSGSGVNFPQFVEVLSVFRSSEVPARYEEEEEEEEGAQRLAAMREKKLNFAFRIYDVNGDGFIDAGELLQVLKMMVRDNIEPEQLDRIVAQTMTEADRDKDGKISLEEFRKVLEKTNLDARLTIRF